MSAPFNCGPRLSVSISMNRVSSVQVAMHHYFYENDNLPADVNNRSEGEQCIVLARKTSRAVRYSSPDRSLHTEASNQPQHVLLQVEVMHVLISFFSYANDRDCNRFLGFASFIVTFTCEHA